jgi:hypothetical protein
MYYTGRDPETGRPVYVPRTFEEKKAQKRLLEEYLSGELTRRKRRLAHRRKLKKS